MKWITALLKLPLRILKSRVLSHLIFWSWNMAFLAFIFIGLLPWTATDIATSVIEGSMPLDFFLVSLALIAVPVVCTVAGVHLARAPEKLRELFFGVEAPSVLLLLFRLFLVRELTPGTTFMLVVFASGTFAYAYGIFKSCDGEPRASLVVHLIGHTACLWLGVYLTLLLAIYAVPLAAYLGLTFLRFEWMHDLVAMAQGPGAPERLIGGGLALLLIVLSACFFVMLPVALIVLYHGRWWRTFARARAILGVPSALAIAGVVLLAVTSGFAVSNHQPQRAVFALLSTAPSTDAERRTLLASEDELRDGLLNAYLAPYRYMASTGASTMVEQLYARVMSVPERYGAWVQSFHDILAAPMLYRGDEAHPDERERAAVAYQQFFDVSIQRGEKDAVLRALAATYDSDSRESGLLNEGGQKVHVERQDVDLVEHETYADIELHEVYRNLTHEQQEIFYYFTLPPSAVVTGLWLGDTDDRAKRFPFVVAPRGAAQEVYRREVARRVDPALLEQVGPAQYRLRAFPVPPRLFSSRATDVASSVAPSVLHLWLTVKVLPDDGRWPLPRLAERRNVFADGSTERFLNGTPRKAEVDDEWLPAFLSASRAPVVRSQTFVFTDDMAVRVEPVVDAHSVPAPGRTYALILDRSRSMGRNADELAKSFAWLSTSVMPRSDVDLYLTSAPTRGEGPKRIDEPSDFDPRQTVFFGGQDPAEMLDQFDALRGEKRYDAILVLTDDGALDGAEDQDEATVYDVPLWMVHLGGRMPPGYSDAITETIERSGGGVTTSVERAMQSLALAERSQRAFIAFEDGYAFSLVKVTEAELESEGEVDAGFAPIAARALLKAGAQTSEPGALYARDRLHAVAKKYGIVTPLSSMIVLVNDTQRQALAEAENKDDRFDRELESGEERLSVPLGGFAPIGDITAVPEPEEWALIFAGAFVLGVAMIERRQRQRQSS